MRSTGSRLFAGAFAAVVLGLGAAACGDDWDKDKIVDSIQEEDDSVSDAAAGCYADVVLEYIKDDKIGDMAEGADDLKPEDVLKDPDKEEEFGKKWAECGQEK